VLNFLPDREIRLARRRYRQRLLAEDTDRQLIAAYEIFYYYFFVKYIRQIYSLFNTGAVLDYCQADT